MSKLLVAGLVAYVGCGSSNHTGQDAPPSSGDAAAADAHSGSSLVTVHVQSSLGDGKPDTTAVVIFMSPTMMPVHDGVVDANGDASWDLPDGGTVTVLQTADDMTNPRRVDNLTTFRGVQPGDTLLAGRPKSPKAMLGMSVPMTAHMPADAMNAILYFECGSSSSNGPSDPMATLTFWDTCRSTSFDLLALRDMNGQRDYMWQSNVGFVAHGDVTINDTFAPIGHYTANLTHLNLNARVGIWSYSLINSFPLQLELQSLDPPMSDTATMSLQYPPGGGGGTLLVETEATGIQVLEGHALLATSSPASIDIDMSELPLPHIGHAVPGATGVTWTETAAGAPDARIVTWFGQWSGPMSHSATWTFVEPPATATSTAMIPLPDAYAADDPTANGATASDARVWYFDFDNLAGYEQARPHAMELMDQTTAFLTVDHHSHYRVSP